MKKALLIICAVLFALITFAQSPTIPFQAVARDTSGILIQNQRMAVRTSIHDITATGTVIYEDTQSVTTNNLGLFTLNIGGGTLYGSSPAFSTISWASGPKFVQLEVDPTGGTSYINLGTTRLNSVPYALYAANSPGSNPPPTRIPYGGTITMVTDSNFTRDSATGQTHMACTDGSTFLSYFSLRTDHAGLGFYDSSGYINLVNAGGDGEFGFGANTVAAITIDGNHNVMHGLYAMRDSTELITTALDSNGNYSNTSYYGLAGTQAYSAYFDVLYNGGTSLNSLTLDNAGLHWEYNSANQYTFPLTDGSSDQFVKTDGSGHLTFANLPANVLTSHQLLAGTGGATDTINPPNHKNTIYKPSSSVTSLAINLPGSPSDGDTFILTFAAAVSSVSYQNGIVGTSVPTSAAATLQKIFTYDLGTSTWY